MSTKTEAGQPTRNAALDWLKWLVVAALVVGGIFGNWYYQEETILIRALVLVGVAAVAVFVGLQTDRGRAIRDMAREARTEIRRVVWPTRQETTQTTLIVVVLILVFALILWGLDSALSLLVKSVIG